MQQLRMRVIIGHDDEGNAIVRRVGAYDELSLADRVIEAVVKSGRIYEFFGVDAHPQQPMEPQPEPMPEPVRTPLSQYADRWFNTYKRGLARTTEVFYNSKVNVMKRFFGDKPIEAISADDVQRFVTSRAEKYSKKTVHDDLAAIKELLDSAVCDGIISANPARDKRIRNTAKAGEGTVALTREQMAKIQQDIPLLKDSNERCLIALLAYTSMRREEVLGLRWECVDFGRHEMTIREAVVYVGSQTHIKETKTKGSTRAFPMCLQLEEILASCRRPSGYVIQDERGNPLSHSRYYTLWKSLSSHIELYGMSAINFRTTFATLAIASGVDVRTTQSLMGHSTPEMTLKIYTKQEMSRLENAMDVVTKFVNQGA